MGPLLPRPLPSAFAPAAWREWWDFGGGTLAASGTPAMALIHRAMDLRAPSEISAEGPALHLQRCPEWLVSRWVFSRDAPASPLTVCWRHGVPPSRIELPADALSSSLPQGVLFCGAQGSLRVVPGRAWILRPGEPDLLLGSGTGEGGRIREWLSACRTGAATACGVVAASPVAECLLLGNVAFRTDRRLTWDARELAAPNLPEASEYIQHSYGPGWTI